MATDLETLKAELLANVDPSDSGALDKALNAVKIITEMEKTQSEKAKLDHDRCRTDFEAETLRHGARLETTRLWLPITVPAISAILLSLFTLAFQFYQLKKTTELQNASAAQAAAAQRRTQDDAQWRSAIQTLSEAKSPDAIIAGLTSLATFDNSETYKGPAHTLALQYLTREQDPNVFRALCSIAFSRAKWSDFEDLTAINRTLGDRYNTLFTEAKDPKTKNKTQLQAVEDNVRHNIVQLNSKLVDAIKDRPPSAILVLDSLSLFESNLKGINFGDADIRFTTFENSDLSDADLGRVRSFDQNNFGEVTWWKVRAANDLVLSDLKSRFPFREPATDYWAVPTNAKDYSDNLTRLEHRK